MTHCSFRFIDLMVIPTLFKQKKGPFSVQIHCMNQNSVVSTHEMHMQLLFFQNPLWVWIHLRPENPGPSNGN